MELKKDPIIYDETPGQTVSDAKKNLSNDYSRSGTNTTYVGVQAAEYDDKIEKNSFRISEEEMKKALSKTAHEKKEQNSKILLVTEIITYLAFAFLVFTVFRTSRLEAYDIIYNMKNVSLALIILTGVLIIDALFVFFLEARKPMLFIFAAILGVFYPIYRSKIVNGRLGIGVVCSLLTCFAWIMLFVTAGQAVTKYGKEIIYTEDEFTRHEAVALMEQENANGKPLGIVIKNIDKKGILEITASESGDKTTLIVSGVGPKDINIGNLNFNNPNGININLTFEKKTETDPYEIKDISFDDTSLTSSQLKKFWATLQ